MNVLKEAMAVILQHQLAQILMVDLHVLVKKDTKELEKSVAVSIHKHEITLNL